MDITQFSHIYQIQKLTDAHAPEIMRLCQSNPQYYRYAAAKPTLEQIHQDMRITPPGVELSAKHYVGYFLHGQLTAVLDLVEGYPEPGMAYIGFFMVDKAFQGLQIGSAIIRELTEALVALGIHTLRLGMEKDNPQSTHFWQKNGFKVIKEVEQDRIGIWVGEKITMDA